MTSLEAIAKLQLLLDKTGSPYFTTDEYLSFLNMASLEILNRMVPDTLGGVANFELDQNTFANIEPLVRSVDLTPVSEGGVDRGRFLKTALSTGAGGREVFRVISIGVYTSSSPYVLQPVAFTKQNNINTHLINTFKKPSSSNYIYIVDRLEFTVFPRPSGFVRFTIIMMPTIMTDSNSPDWNDYMMNQVIQVAYQMATVATRDEVGLQLGTNTTIQSK